MLTCDARAVQSCSWWRTWVNWCVRRVVWSTQTSCATTTGRRRKQSVPANARVLRTGVRASGRSNMVRKRSVPVPDRSRDPAGRFQGSETLRAHAGADEDDDEARRIESNAVRNPPCPMPARRAGASRPSRKPEPRVFGHRAQPERVWRHPRPRACPTTLWLGCSFFSVSFHGYPR